MDDLLKFNIDQALAKERRGGIISSGITWVDGRIRFNYGSKYSSCYYGVCHYGEGVGFITPLDFINATMEFTSIEIMPDLKYCEKAKSCLHFQCFLNRWDIESFLADFKDVGAASLGIKPDANKKALWFNTGVYRGTWKGFIIPQAGGRLEFDEEQAKKEGIY